MLITGLAWGIASTHSVAGIIRLALLYISVHFIAFSLLTATAAFFLVGRLLRPGILGLPGRRRQQGLFTQLGDGEQLEFGYCFDVSREKPRPSKAKTNGLHGLGSNPRLFPSLVPALCCTVSTMALDIQEILVC